MFKAFVEWLMSFVPEYRTMNRVKNADDLKALIKEEFPGYHLARDPGPTRRQNREEQAHQEYCASIGRPVRPVGDPEIGEAMGKLREGE